MSTILTINNKIIDHNLIIIMIKYIYKLFTIYCLMSFFFLIVHLTMDDVSSETCLVLKNEFKKHRVVHQSHLQIYS